MPPQDRMDGKSRGLVWARLSTADFDPEAFFFECAYESLSLVSLDLDDALLDGATRSASFLEVAGEIAERIGGYGDTFNEGHRLAFSSASGPADSHDSVSGGGRRGCFLLLASTSSRGRAAVGAEPSMLG